MKNSKYIIAIAVFIVGCTFALHAQDTILNRNVSVEREYRPVIIDAGKINSVPQVLEPTVVKTPAKYSDFNLPINVGFNIHTLTAADLSYGKPKANEGFARIGLGNYLNTMADFQYPVVNTPDMRLDFSLNHLGTFEPKRMHSTTKAALSFDKLFKTFDLYAGVGGGHEYQKLYGNNYDINNNILDLNKLNQDANWLIYSERQADGLNPNLGIYDISTLANQPIGDTFWRFNSTLGFRSLPLSTDLTYLAEMHYNLFHSQFGMTENMVNVSAKFSSPLKANRLGVDFDMNNMNYSSSTASSLNFWNTYTVLNLNPYYKIDKENWNVRLGVKSAFSFVHGNFINPSVDVAAEWKPFPKFLSVYGGLTGDYQINTLDKIYSENPFIYSDVRVKDTYTPFDLYAGIKLKPFYNLLVNAYVDIRQIDDQYFYVNKEYYMINPPYIPLVPFSFTNIYSNRFQVIYRDASLVKLGARLAYNYKNTVNVELKGVINSWNVNSEAYAWNKPKYEAELNTNIRINPNLSVSANAYFEGTRYAKLGNVAYLMNDKVDINLGVSYNYNRWLTAFAKINNLINNRYQNFYGYDVQGTNAMVGAAFTF